MKIIIDSKVEPKFPPSRHVYEMSSNLCECGSSYYKDRNFFSFLFSKRKKCINPNCDNYYNGFPSSELNDEYGVYVNGNLEYQWRFENE